MGNSSFPAISAAKLLEHFFIDGIGDIPVTLPHQGKTELSAGLTMFWETGNGLHLEIRGQRVPGGFVKALIPSANVRGIVFKKEEVKKALAAV